MITKILNYGISLEKIHKEISPKFSGNNNFCKTLFLNYIQIEENPFDCGCLMIGCLKYIHNKEDLTLIEKFASLSGYSKIIGTVIDNSLEKNYIKTLQENNYTFIPTGPSSRNPELNSWLIYKVIDTEVKGYI